MKRAEIHTKKGVMKIKFFEEDAPNTVKNFISLAEKGFYDGLIFHRVIPIRRHAERNLALQESVRAPPGEGEYHVYCKQFSHHR